MVLASTEALFDDILEFIASSPSAQELVNYQPPEHLQERLSELLDKNRKEGLSETAQAELDEFLRINRFMSRLRLKARQRLTS